MKPQHNGVAPKIDATPPTLRLPPRPGDAGPIPLETAGRVVVVGANGSGKTRLGVWLEFKAGNTALVRRLSAQKSLIMPPSTTYTSPESGLRILNYGADREATKLIHRIGNRWGLKPETHLLDDYESLMAYLFAEDAEVSTRFRRAARGGGQLPGVVPESKLDTVQRIWHTVLPHRVLDATSGRVHVKRPGAEGDGYNGSEMSDGERVVFYLIGQCLTAPENGIVIIDEPEIHLHKSIQAPLWDAIEAERPDLLFVYLTHDLEFAAGRPAATKVWLAGYDGARWDWHLLPDVEGLPEPVLMAVLGSRRPILFVEGEAGSLDMKIYPSLYPAFTVVPCGSGTHVVNAVASFSTQQALHHMSCRGLVDRDHRTPEQIRFLADRGVHVGGVAQIESLFVAEGVLRFVGEKLLLPQDDTTRKVDAVKAEVLDQLAAQRVKVASSMTAVQIESRLKRFDAKAQGGDALTKALNDLAGGIDAPAIYAAALAEVDAVLAAKNYEGSLRLHRTKGLLSVAGKHFGMSGDALRDLLLRAMTHKDGGKAVEAMRDLMPAISP